MNTIYLKLLCIAALTGCAASTGWAAEAIEVQQQEIDLSDEVSKAELLALVDDVPLAKALINRVYEREPKPLIDSRGKNPHGSTFPLYAEVMAHLMKDIQGKTVVELGAANGEHALLLLLAGAERVYVNDIEEENFDLLREDIATLPRDYADRIHLLPGDCFQLSKKEELQLSCDLVLARNLVHFFTSDDHKRFAKLVSCMLKPGGRALISVNAPFVFAPRKLIEENPDCCVFAKITPAVCIPHKMPRIIGKIGEFFPCAGEDAFMKGHSWDKLVEFNRNGPQKSVEFGLFSQEFQQVILKEAKELVSNNGLKSLIGVRCSIDCHKSFLQLYTKHTLPKLVRYMPLNLEHSCYITYNGHVTHDEQGAAALMVLLQKDEVIEDGACFTCSKKNAPNKCGGCRYLSFCDRACLVAAWPVHKKDCKKN